MTQDHADPKPRVDRRAVLTGAGLATATAAASAALLPPKAEAFNATPAENAQRYKESDHVKNFYKVAGR
jgi:hypothetical protein